MKKPTLEMRATFVGLFLGVAADIGYDRTGLRQDMRRCLKTNEVWDISSKEKQLQTEDEK